MGGIYEGLHGDYSFQIGEHVWSMWNNLEKKYLEGGIFAPPPCGGRPTLGYIRKMLE